MVIPFKSNTKMTKKSSQLETNHHQETYGKWIHETITLSLILDGLKHYKQLTNRDNVNT